MDNVINKPVGVSNEAWDLPYKPVPLNHEDALARDIQNPAFRAEWDALADEFAALDVLLDARRKAGLTQAEVAERMGVSQPALARVEASLGSRKHSPSLATLRKYAKACGKHLEIRLV
jgi:DNA-binding XRE family transcriptional regulator